MPPRPVQIGRGGGRSVPRVSCGRKDRRQASTAYSPPQTRFSLGLVDGGRGRNASVVDLKDVVVSPVRTHPAPKPPAPLSPPQRATPQRYRHPVPRCPKEDPSDHGWGHQDRGESDDLGRLRTLLAVGGTLALSKYLGRVLAVSVAPDSTTPNSQSAWGLRRGGEVQIGARRAQFGSRRGACTCTRGASRGK